MISNNLILKKICQYITLLIKAKWTIKNPPQKKYFVIGKKDKDILSEILKENFFFFEENNQEIYFKVFLKTVLEFSYKGFLYRYYINIIKEINH